MGKIVRYDPVVYPFKLWVAIAPNMADLRKRFCVLTDVSSPTSLREIVDDDVNRNWDACCIDVVDKKSFSAGCLVMLLKDDYVNVIKLFVHEISHACDSISTMLGLPNYGETRAYLSGWMMECVIDYIRKDSGRSVLGNG